jgi:hypothetical protein
VATQSTHLILQVIFIQVWQKQLVEQLLLVAVIFTTHLLHQATLPLQQLYLAMS